jgi:hypothetical protein
VSKYPRTTIPAIGSICSHSEYTTRITFRSLLLLDAERLLQLLLDRLRRFNVTLIIDGLLKCRRRAPLLHLMQTEKKFAAYSCIR